MAKSKSQWKSVRVTPEMSRMLEQIAETDDRTIDSVIRLAVQEFIERRARSTKAKSLAA